MTQPSYNYSNTFIESTLVGDVLISDTSIVLASVQGLPEPPFSLILNYGSSTFEIVTATDVTGNTIAVLRGEDGTSPTAFSAGSLVVHAVVARDLQRFSDHLKQGIEGSMGATSPRN